MRQLPDGVAWASDEERDGIITHYCPDGEHYPIYECTTCHELHGDERGFSGCDNCGINLCCAEEGLCRRCFADEVWRQRHHESNWPEENYHLLRR